MTFEDFASTLTKTLLVRLNGIVASIVFMHAVGVLNERLYIYPKANTTFICKTYPLRYYYRNYTFKIYTIDEIIDEIVYDFLSIPKDN